MSREVFLKNQIRSLLSASKNDVDTKIYNFNEAVTDTFGQVDNELVSLRARVSALENTIENLPVVVQFIQNSRLFVDNDGDLAQDDLTQTQEEE